MTAYLVFFAITVLIYAIAVLGLNLQWGYNGMFNAGIAGFLAVGGYVTALLIGPPAADRVGGFELPFVVGIAGAMAAAALAALVIGFATIRLREDYLAIATFGIAIAIQLVAVNTDSLTGGSNGIAGIQRPFASLFDGPFTYNLFYLALVAGVLLVAYLALEAIVRSPWGRVLRAIREDEAAASALGKSPTQYRLQAFVLGSMLMGLAGGLFASFFGFVSPADFAPIVTFQLWTMLIVGGAGNNRGALIGAYVVWGLWSGSGALLHELLPAALQVRGAALQIVLLGIMLALILLFRPRGLIGEEAVVSRHARL